MTMISNTPKKEELYRFRRKTFSCDAETIARLNYALALNHSTERYVKVEKKEGK
jgi:hypothetical protein